MPKATLPHFWKIVCVGAHTAIQDNNATIIWRGPRVENKTEAQKHLMDFYIDKKVDAIVIAPTHKSKLNSSIEKAMAAGIKVIVIDSRTSAGKQHSFIATDNYKAGKIGAKLLLQKIHKKGPLLLMGSMPDSSSVSEREQGFIDGINELAPGMSVIRMNILEGTGKEAELAAKEIIRNTNSLAGIFAVNEVSSEGVLQALNKQEINGLPFVGFDYSSTLLEGIESGRVSALITQVPFAMGYMGVRTALELLEGKQIVPEMECPVRIITRDNIEDSQNLRCLRKFSERERDSCPMCFN
ncbi:substrate-binding domain-containing protein [Maridesulfovibrio sp. FT414]